MTTIRQHSLNRAGGSISERALGVCRIGEKKEEARRSEDATGREWIDNKGPGKGSKQLLARIKLQQCFDLGSKNTQIVRVGLWLF